MIFTSLSKLAFLHCSETENQGEKMSAFGITGLEEMKSKSLEKKRGPYVGNLKGKVGNNVEPWKNVNYLNYLL